MSETYCGKSCNNCTYKESLGCSGCRECMGKPETGKCELAKCCRDKGHETCESCAHKMSCVTRQRRQNIPQYMLEKQNAEAEYKAESESKAEIVQTAPVLGKWLSVLFWLNISTILANFLANKYIAEWIPILYMSGQMISILCTMACGIVLLKLGKENDRYTYSNRYIYSGGCCLVAEMLNVVFAIFPAMQIILLELISVIIVIVREYYEYTGHAEVLQRIDFELSEKWRMLWKWYIGLFAALIGSVFLVYLLPLLGFLALLATIIVLVIVVILKNVYLYRTAKLFQEYS